MKKLSNIIVIISIVVLVVGCTLLGSSYESFIPLFGYIGAFLAGVGIFIGWEYK